MNFCEKCIHYDMCNYEYEHQDTDAILTFFPNNTECPWFKNKADFVEVKHGKWYRHTQKEHGDTCFYCSVCEEMALSDCMVWELTDYCPHCGAKMDGTKGSD